MGYITLPAGTSNHVYDITNRHAATYGDDPGRSVASPGTVLIPSSTAPVSLGLRVQPALRLLLRARRRVVISMRAGGRVGDVAVAQLVAWGTTAVAADSAWTLRASQVSTAVWTGVSSAPWPPVDPTSVTFALGFTRTTTPALPPLRRPRMTRDLSARPNDVGPDLTWAAILGGVGLSVGVTTAIVASIWDHLNLTIAIGLILGLSLLLFGGSLAACVKYRQSGLAVSGVCVRFGAKRSSSRDGFSGGRSDPRSAQSESAYV